MYKRVLGWTETPRPPFFAFAPGVETVAESPNVTPGTGEAVAVARDGLGAPRSSVLDGRMLFL